MFSGISLERDSFVMIHRAGAAVGNSPAVLQVLARWALVLVLVLSLSVMSVDLFALERTLDALVVEVTVALCL